MQISSGIFLRKSNQHTNTLITKALGLFPNFTEEQVNQQNFDVFTAVNLSSKTNPYSQIGMYSTDDFVISGDIRLYNFNELAYKTNPNLVDNHFQNHQLVLEYIIKFGYDTLKDINGDFVFSIYNKNTKEFFIARDHMGQKPLFYSISDDEFVYSTHINGVFINDKVSTALNEKWILNYLQKNISSNAETVYQQVKKLPPAHYIVINYKEFTLKNYWKLEKSKSKHTVKTLPEAINIYHDLLTQAVQARLHNSTKIGCEFSGGLDSSGIGGMAQQLLTPKNIFINAYTNVLDEEVKKSYTDFTDEWDKAHAIALHNSIKKHETVCEAALPPEELIEFDLKALGYPSTMGFSALQLGIYLKSQQNQNEILISGFGGDELVTEHASGRYAFSLIKEKQFVKLWKFNSKKSKHKLKGLVNTLRQVANFNIGKEKKFAQNLGKGRWELVALKEEWVKRYNLKEKYINNHYFPPNQTLRERSLFRVYLEGTTERLETCYAMTNFLGLNYTYPLWDVRLMEFYYHLPDAWKAHPIFNRMIYRKAMEKYFPQDLLNQPKPRNTATIPFVKEILKNESDVLEKKCLAIQNPIVEKYLDFDKLKGLKNLDRENPFLFNNLRCILTLDKFTSKVKVNNG